MNRVFFVFVFFCYSVAALVFAVRVTQRAIPTRVHARTGLLLSIYTSKNQFFQTGQL